MSARQVAARLSLSLVTATYPLLSHAAEKALILDRDTNSVSAVDLSSGAVTGTIAIPGEPQVMFLSPDGRRLVVLDRVPMKQKLIPMRIYAGTSLAATILDARTLTVVARIELGTGTWEAMKEGLGKVSAVFEPPIMTPDGKYMVMAFPGDEYGFWKPPGDKARQPLPPTLVSVDLAQGRIAARLSLERPADRLWLVTPDKLVAAFLGGTVDKRSLPAEIRLIEVEGLTLAATNRLESELVAGELSPDGLYFYAIDRRSKIHAYSAANGSLVKTIDVGGGTPWGLLRNDTGNQVVVPIRGTTKQPSRLAVLQGTDVTASLEAVATHFVVMSPSQLCLAYGGGKDKEEVTVVDLAAEPPSVERLPANTLAGTSPPANLPAILREIDAFDGFMLSDAELGGVVGFAKTEGSGILGLFAALGLVSSGAQQAIRDSAWQSLVAAEGPGEWPLFRNVSGRRNPKAWTALSSAAVMFFQGWAHSNQELHIWPSSSGLRTPGKRAAVKSGRVTWRFGHYAYNYMQRPHGPAAVVTSAGTRVVEIDPGLGADHLNVGSPTDPKQLVHPLKGFKKPAQVLILDQP